MASGVARRRDEPAEETYEFCFNSETQLRSHFEESHSLILLAGGLGSGKTVLHGHSLIRRAVHETDQLGGIFTNTQTTLEKGVFGEITKLFKNLGKEKPEFDHRPPMRWVRQWVRDGIEIPELPRYRNVLTTPDGVHTLCGTLSTIRGMHQYETLQLGWLRLEEAINNTRDANATLIERVRCCTGGANNPDCAKYHKHTSHLIFNPPRKGHPYLVPYLDELEEAAKPYYHALRDGENCGGCFYVISDPPFSDVCVAKVHGPELDHRGWPLLIAGTGPTILIKSKTSDNALNLDRGYRTRLAANMSQDVARRRLDGEIVREEAGGAYPEFSRDNINPAVPYDADRTLYLFLDFNLSPRAASFGHPLNPGEYRGEWEREGLLHIGVFGEYFYAGEMSDRKFAQDLIRGGRGDGLGEQAKYRDEALRGLPRSCHKCDGGCDKPCLEKCEKVCRAGHWNGLRGHRGPIVAYGDQRGGHRSSHGDNLESSWDIVDQEFLKLGNYAKDVPENQPSPRARVDSVCAKLCSALGIRSLHWHPRCEESIRDCELVVWADDQKALREWRFGKERFRTHLLDGVGYGVCVLSPGVGGGDPHSDFEDAFGGREPTKVKWKR
ncbi:MAG TPA: hypothetical protein VLC46_16465 [Thermoanaerobaculia bacterium]|jgi:hypothetical protein|nr:hypothetical protein [Thermoanaerobaculia bacterium]